MALQEGSCLVLPVPPPVSLRRPSGDALSLPQPHRLGAVLSSSLALGLLEVKPSHLRPSRKRQRVHFFLELFELCVSLLIWIFFHLKKVQSAIVLVLGRVWLFATPWTVAHWAPLSMEFSRREYWSVWPFPSPRGSSPPRNWTWVSGIAGRFFTVWATREAFSQQ